MNWIKWSLNGNEFPLHCQESLLLQAKWLFKRIEWHLSGNHLFANAKALIFAGLRFEGKFSAKLLSKGLSIIKKELEEQILKDGGHFERSPMYHAIILEDILDLINAAQTWPDIIPDSQVNAWRLSAGKMLGWLKAMIHPDGQIAFFNDSAFYVAAEFSELKNYAQGLKILCQPAVTSSGQAVKVQHMKQSGYLRLSTEGAVALLDLAPIGPDYLPGHAHADTLSFELSIAGRRVLVNGEFHVME